jgi:hypothetical protein
VTSLKTLINPILDELIININSYRMELFTALIMHDLGKFALETIDDRTTISPKLGFELHIEPIQIGYIKRFKDNYPHFLLEVFHGKFVTLWQDLLNNIFIKFIELHLSSIRKFEELKKIEIRLDFTSTDNFNDQIKKAIIYDFNFRKFSERQKLINKLLNSMGNGQRELDNIFKNTLIRNIIQHRKKIINDYVILKLGRSQIEILDNEGNIKNYNCGDSFELSIPEIEFFMKSILFITNLWRIKDV